MEAAGCEGHASADRVEGARGGFSALLLGLRYGLGSGQRLGRQEIEMDATTSQDVSRGEITGLLRSWSAGDSQALDRLMPAVYDPLRRIAASFLRRERPNHTLQTACLVNEAYLRLVDQSQVSWRDRVHFFAIAGQIMRRVLVDHARRHGSAKRGGSWERIALADAGLTFEPGEPGLLDLDDALSHLAALDPETARLVELRYFSGLTKQETAEVMGISSATVIRRWRMARAWLHGFLVEGRSYEP